MHFTDEEEKSLLSVARGSIAHGFREGTPLWPPLDVLPPALVTEAASFVSLYLDERLQGCTGGLEARQPLARDVAQHAFGTAFHDSRFDPLQPAELAEARIEVSVLSPLEAVPVASEQALGRLLRPGVDGLLLVQGRRQATFLPKVWASLCEPETFLAELRRKAGIDAWSAATQVFRYRAYDLSE